VTRQDVLDLPPILGPEQFRAALAVRFQVRCAHPSLDDEVMRSASSTRVGVECLHGRLCSSGHRLRVSRVCRGGRRQCCADKLA
jgi:hypothetical protein